MNLLYAPASQPIALDLDQCLPWVVRTELGTSGAYVTEVSMRSNTKKPKSKSILSKAKDAIAKSKRKLSADSKTPKKKKTKEADIIFGGGFAG
jgi:hypothetical protein